MLDQYYSFLIMPDDKDPAEDLLKIFKPENGWLEQGITDVERSWVDANHEVIEYHLNLMSYPHLIKIIEYFGLSFLSMDNSQYIEPDTSSLGDLTYANATIGTKLVIFMPRPWGTPFKVWALKLKNLLTKQE